MDKYIRILLIQLSKKYKITIINILTAKDNKTINIYKIIIKDNKDETRLSKDFYNKRDVVGELMKWQKG